MENEYAHIIMNLLLVIGLLLVAMWFVRKFKLNNTTWSKQIKVINSISISPKEKIVLLEVNSTLLLIGATPNHINTLHTFEKQEDPCFSVLLKQAEVRPVETMTLEKGT